MAEVGTGLGQGNGSVSAYKPTGATPGSLSTNAAWPCSTQTLARRPPPPTHPPMPHLPAAAEVDAAHDLPDQHPPTHAPTTHKSTLSPRPTCQMPQRLTRRVISRISTGASRFWRRRRCTQRKLISTVRSSEPFTRSVAGMALMKATSLPVALRQVCRGLGGGGGEGVLWCGWE